MSRPTVLGLLLLISGSAFGQGIPHNNVALSTLGVPLPSAAVRVCTVPAAGTACTPLTSLFSDQAMSAPISNPTAADSYGNYSFYAACGYYEVQVSYGTQTNTSTIYLPCTDINSVAYTPNLTWAQACARVPAGGELFVPAATTVLTAATCPVSQNFHLRCGSNQTSIVKTTAAIALLTGSGTVKEFSAENCNLDGNSLGTSMLSVPAFGGGVDWSQGTFYFAKNIVKNWTARAISVGASNYWLALEDNQFINNAGDLDAGDAAEIRGLRNEWYDPLDGTSNSKVRLSRESTCLFQANDFELNSSTATGPDIEFAIGSAGNGGYCNFLNNKFGAEGESAGRIKVRINGDVTRETQNLRFIGNNFSCASGQTAIKIDSALSRSEFKNFFNSCSTLVNDNYTLLNSSGVGGNTFEARVYQDGSALSAPIPFTNGGRGFSSIVVDTQSADANDVWHAPQIEALKVQNDIPRTALTATWTLNNVTVAGANCNQTGPYGDATGCLVVRSTTGADNFQVNLDFQSDTSKQEWCNVWAKADTATRFTVSLFDNTPSAPIAYYNFYLPDTQWHRFPMAWGGVDKSHTVRFIGYPGGLSGGSATGQMYFDKIQCSPLPSSFLTTTGAAATNSTQGLALMKQLGLVVATGTAPLAVSSSTPVANLTGQILSYNSAGTQQTSSHAVVGSCTLGTDCSVTLSGSAVFTSSSTYMCAGFDKTATNAVRFNPSSGSAFALTGTGTDVLSFVCIGN